MAKPPVAKRAGKSASQPTGTAAQAAPVPTIASAMAPKPAARKAKVAARKAAMSPAAPAPALAAEKAAKAHKPKLVRDSFTIPKNEYQVLDALKQRALGLQRPVRKSELLRAGIQVLDAMGDKALLKALSAVPTLKTGRPKAD